MAQSGDKYALNARIPWQLYEMVKRAADAQNLDLTGAAQQAFRAWLRDTPAARSEFEMWCLRALRAMEDIHPGLMAKSLLSLSVSADEDAGWGMPEDMHAKLTEFSESYEAELEAKRARRTVLPDRKRKA